MPVQVSYPGVYIQEVPSGVRTITGVSTSIGMFVGMASNGPLNKPTRVLSFSEYERKFGNDVSAGEMTDQIRQFFLNGGQQAYISRIADSPAAARAFLQDEFGNSDVLELEARSAGAVGGTLRMRVDFASSSTDSRFNLTVFREVADPSGVLQSVELESFTDLTMRPTARKYAVDELNLRSRHLVARSTAGLPGAISGYSIAGTLMGAAGSGVVELGNIITAADPISNTGSFRISVNEAAFVTATISIPASDAAADIDAAITLPVNTALAVTGTSISASVISLGGLNALQITSDSPDGSVRILPALSRDIAVAMQMGAAQGGIEVDGYAVQRPAPTGVFSVLGTSLGAFDAIDAFIATDPAAVTQFDITDSSAGAPSTTSVGGLVWSAPPGTQMSRGSLTGDQQDSLLNVSENLEALIAQLNASPVLQWSARLAGLRIELTPEFGGTDADLTASIATVGGVDLGAAAAIFGQLPNVAGYRLGAPLPSSYQTAGAPASNGVFPKPQDYTTAFEVIAREVDLFNLMVLPRATDQTDADRASLWPLASAFCRDQRAFLIVDPKEDWLGIDTITTGPLRIDTLRTGLVKDHSAVYWPRLIVNTPEGGQRTVDPAGSIAGLAARIDSNRGVWKAPAGIEAAILGVRGIEHPMADAENGVINPEAVNAIRAFPNGIVSWGARTMDGFDNSGNDDYKYVPVRRFALFIEESLYRGLKFAVFEPNAEPLWAQIRLAAGAFMNNLFRLGAFKGEKKSNAYFVKVDAETTTQNDINLGIVNVVVGFAPLKPAEFVIVTIQQMAGQIEV